ncbi:MAG: hypothetical protein V4615_05080 [Bacteroidota bacterium]
MILHDELMKATIATSRFEESRDYISLSNIFKPVDELLNDYNHGYTTNDEGKIKCRMGYWMEEGLMQRLLKIGGVKPSRAIEVPNTNGLIKGHPDFFWGNVPGDCKSFLLDQYLPEPNKLSRKIYWQMNAYMLYSNTDSSIVVCESRESGMIKTIQVRRNAQVCALIDDKVRAIFQQLKSAA